MGWTSWIECVGKAIEYIEANITRELSVDEIARQVALSPFYFQKGFAMLCGYTVGEYVRQRRLTLAGAELISTDKKIIDIALNYGYDSPDSFTKAFTRFHGTTPTAVRRDGATIKSFAPLKIFFSLKGGYIMDYKIVEKDAFTIIGVTKNFKYDNAKTEVPKFWQEFCSNGGMQVICSMYGVSIDHTLGSDEFEYLIADDYKTDTEVPNGFVTKEIPAYTWAIFPCTGAMPNSLQDLQSRIFSEWLPSCTDYEIAAGYNIEMYSDPADYPKGTLDEGYYCEAWIPVKRK